MTTKAEPDWIRLQRLIFTRWCKQKLVRRPEIYPRVNDIATDMSDGLVLIALIEELAEKKCPDKINWEKPETSRIKKVAVVNTALKFAYSFVTDQKLKASPEDLVDGRVDNILALIWSIMLRFIKIGDDDDEASAKLNAKEALLMWCQNKCQGYKQISSLDNFKKTPKNPHFHNGLALCAIIHKHRPKLVPEMDSLDERSDPLKTIEIAQNAAEKYFGLEKFLSPTDVTKLDESSMVVYVAEFYIGISNQRKIDLAARRIDKLVKYTKENDRLRKEYNTTAHAYKERLARVEETLNDRTIDNTMAGAEAKLADFYKYKTEDKNVLLGNQLDLEAAFNNLAMRLSHHKRPEFIPPEGVTLQDVEKALSHLEQVEQERSVALHAELNRQIRLAKLAQQHTTIYDNLKAWTAEKGKYLNERPIIDTVSSAQLQLKRLEAFTKERAAMQSTTQAKFKEITAELVREKYEHATSISEHEAEIDKACQQLDEMASKRHPVLGDDLERETYKQQVRLSHKEFCKRFEVLSKDWIAPKEKYLNTYVEIHSVEEANVQLSLLDLHEKDCNMMGNSLVSALRKLAKQVLDAKYESQYSSYQFEHTKTMDPVHEYQEPEQRQAVADNETFVAEKWDLLAKLTEKMKAILKDHLQRETTAAKTRVFAANYQHKLKQIQHWVTESELYLAAREHVHSVSEGRTEVTKITVFTKQLELMKSSQVHDLSEIAKELLACKYESELSSYVYEHSTSKSPSFDIDLPEKKAEILSMEDWVAKKWEAMAEAANIKQALHEDHLARELYKQDTHVIASRHDNKYYDLKNWGTDAMKYLEAREHVHSVAEASTHVTQLKALIEDIAAMLGKQVKEMLEVGKELLARKYETQYSHYEFEVLSYKDPSYSEDHPEMKAAVQQHEEDVTKLWTTMKENAEFKLKVMLDHLAREEFLIQTHVIASSHKQKFEELKAWACETDKYLKEREFIHSVGEARPHIQKLTVLKEELALRRQTQVKNLLDLGANLLGRKYETELSFYCYEKTNYKFPEFSQEQAQFRDEVVQNEDWLKKIWDEMEAEAAEKLNVMQDHHDRESFAEEARVIADGHKNKFTELKSWAEESEKYLRQRDHVHSVFEANSGIQTLELFQKELKAMHESQVEELLRIGKDLLGRKRETSLSFYEYEKTTYASPKFEEDRKDLRQAVIDHENFVTNKWQEMDALATRKMEVLKDHLQRETCAVNGRQQGQQHNDVYNKLHSWIVDKDTYLKSRSSINSIGDAQVQLTLFEQYKQEYSMMEPSLLSFYKLNESILNNNYSSDLSSYQYEHMKYSEPEFDDDKPEVKAALVEHDSFVKSHQAELNDMANALSTELQAALALEIKKEQLRLEFAHLALEFVKWSKETRDSLNIEVFGFTLEEVQAYQQTVNNSKAKIAEIATDNLGEVLKVHASMTEAGVKENIYSQITVQELQDAQKMALDSLAARNTAFDKELARQIENDRLCLEFSKVAEPFCKWITNAKNEITASKANLEEQLSFVMKQVDQVATDASKIDTIREWADKIKAAGITHIRHTNLTFRDVEVTDQQFKKFLAAKRTMLETEIKNAKLRGITPEQMKEIEENFKVYDKDNDGKLDRKEFTACLFSLGEERTGKEIKEIMTKVADDKQAVSFDSFKEFLIHVFGDADTKDEILNGFLLINKGQTATHDNMEVVLLPEDVCYIEENAPKTEKGWDYTAWVNDVFSR
eukprot:TRINITY_DN5543_c0_g1_i1.p1 TRINITY_DN5543_c0_g1~~TRINITY_DN5543_c0_g1_i1.p1  ORF type:complete len:1716 (-),score=541.94 TRINITY_DN5543_c0_g1_i1:60-5207(-)